LATHPEALLIAAVIRTGDYQTPMHKGISNEHFHVHRAEWRWIEKYIARHRKTPGKVTFKNKFPELPFKAVDDVEHFCEEVKKDHARFLFTDLMDRSLDLVERDDIDAAVNQVQSGITLIQSSLAGDSGEFDLVKDADLIYEEVKRRIEVQAERGSTGVPFGFKTLDEITGGAQESDYWIVAARFGEGKTWTLNAMVLAAIAAGHDVNYFALEMSAKDIAFRIINLLSSRVGKKKVFGANDLRLGKNFNLIDFKDFIKHMPDYGLGALRLFDSTRGKITPLTIAAKIEQHRPAINFVDYITIMAPDSGWQTVNETSKALASIPVRYECPLIAAAQIGRGGDGKEPPRAVHLSGSDAIGQDATGVVTLAKQSPHVVKFRLAKGRNVEDQLTWYGHFDPSIGKYGEISGNRADEIIARDEEED
jgi:replicative DNA helicase